MTFGNIAGAMLALRNREAEVLESGKVTDLESNRQFIRQVMALGVKLHLDAIPQVKKGCER